MTDTTRRLTERLPYQEEPRLKRWQKVLKYKDAHHRGAFSRAEFVEMAVKLFPHAGEERVGAVFDAAAQRHCDAERVPLEALARAACVLDAAALSPPAVQNAEPVIKRNPLVQA